MKNNSIVIIEDNRLLREGIAEILNKQADMHVLAALRNGENTTQIVKSIRPDIVILGLEFRTRNSCEIVRSIKAVLPGTKLIVIDILPLQEEVCEFIEAGVSGFVLKDAGTRDLVRTIRSVCNGEQVLPPNLTKLLFNQIIVRADTRSSHSAIIETVRMTKREQQVVELIANGSSNKEIAKILQLSLSTVKSHVHNILEKLALHTRVQIANFVHASDDHTSE